MCRLWNLSDVESTSGWSESSSGSGNNEVSVPITVALLPHCAAEGQKFKDVTSISWSPDGQWLATGCYDGTIRVWSSTGKLSMLLREHTGPVFSLKWNKAGTLLLSGSYDQRAIVWSAQNGSIVQVYVVHTAAVLDVDWRAGGVGDIFATCSSDQ
jgi:transducin (beta)-like 1